MTTEQERSIKALAWHVLSQVDAMQAQLQGIVNHSLTDVSVETVEQTFTASIPHFMERIQDILESEHAS